MVAEMLMNGRGIIGPRCKSLLIYLAIVAVNEEHVILMATLTVYTSLNCKDWRAGGVCELKCLNIYWCLCVQGK